MLDGSDNKLKILHVVLSIGETNTTYNEHCLPVADKREIAICTYFRSSIVPPKTIALFEGNGSLIGFFQALRGALAAGDYDAIHAHSPHVALLLLVALLFSRPRALSSTVVTVHDSYQDYKFRNRLMFIPVFAAFRRVVCCSEASHSSFPGFYKWLAGHRLGSVQNGVDIARIDRVIAETVQQPRTNGPFTAVAVSRLVDVKNPLAALIAFQTSLGPGGGAGCLKYIGDGTLRTMLLEKSRAAGLQDQVEFTGLVPREKVFEHLLNADVFISTSRGEGLPISVLEAMACGCPAILSDIPPHREVAQGTNFIPLLDPDDVEGFARELNKYSAMTADQRTSTGRKCRRLVEERFSLDAMHRRYEQVYAQLANSRSHVLVEDVVR